MFQGMFRKRGRPPEQLPIGGYDNQGENETGQIPVHQSLISLEEPRQLPLAPVKEFEHDVVMQQEMMREIVYLFNRCYHNKVIAYQSCKIDDWHMTRYTKWAATPELLSRPQ